MLDDSAQLNTIDHPIFLESIAFIQSHLSCSGLDHLEQQVLQRVIHSSGDFHLQSLLRFTPGACHKGIQAIHAGAPILTDTAMAAAAVIPMSSRTANLPVRTVLEWAPEKSVPGTTRTAIGIERAWIEMTHEFFDSRSPIVLIGSAPKALEVLLDLVDKGANPPSLIVGMPVGFIGVAESKERLSKSGLSNILLDGSRGGAALAAAAINSLLRASICEDLSSPTD